MLRKFLLNSLLLSVPVIALVLTVNIVIDNGFLISDKSPQIARILVSGKNAAIKNIPSDWGALQTAIAEEQKENNKPRKDILVFGTSRSSEISSEIFAENTIYNCAIPGANVLDYVALYGLYKRNEMMPKFLIVSIDPWTFHARKAVTIKNCVYFIADTSQTLTANPDLLPDYRSGLRNLGFSYDSTADKIRYRAIFKTITGLFNFNYFQLNLASLASKMILETDSDYVPSYFVIRKDGSYSIALQSQLDSSRVKSKAKDFIESHKSKYFIPGDTNSVYFEYFKKLMTSLKKDGVTPIVYISPVNPMVFDNLSDSMNVDIENSIDNFCRQNAIQKVGSFNPHKYGYDKVGNYFIDSAHPVKSVVFNIFYQHRNELHAIGMGAIREYKEVITEESFDE